jgi:hypothetical protein
MTPETITEEVEMIGFGAELLEMIENNHEEAWMADPDENEEDNELGTYMPNLVREQNIIKTCTLIVSGMTCASCQATIENHLKSLEGVSDASISLLTHKANIRYKPN